MKIKDQILNICEDYTNGLSINQLSIKYNISSDEIIQILIQNEIITSD